MNGYFIFFFEGKEHLACDLPFAFLYDKSCQIISKLAGLYSKDTKTHLFKRGICTFENRHFKKELSLMPAERTTLEKKYAHREKILSLKSTPIKKEGKNIK